MKLKFSKIYKDKMWKDVVGTESGPGSSIEMSHQYLSFLSDFCDDRKVKSILDLGCGDFNLMKHFNLTHIKYLGVDVVDSVIDENKKLYQSDNVKFINGDITEFKTQLSFDLVLIKDVFQHLNYESIFKCLHNLIVCKNVLITNDYSDENLDCDIGGYRPLNFGKYPFLFKTKQVFKWNSGNFLKHVNLLTYEF